MRQAPARLRSGEDVCCVPEVPARGGETSEERYSGVGWVGGTLFEESELGSEAGGGQKDGDISR